MKSFKQLMGLIREEKEASVKKTQSSQGNPHGTAYEILVASHMKRHLQGDSEELQPHHYPHSVDEHLSDVPQGQHSSSQSLLGKIRQSIGEEKYNQIENHAKEDAKAMVSHMEANDNERFNALKSGLKTGTSRFVHVPDVRKLRDVVHIKKEGKKPSLSSNADIVFTDRNNHIGIDTKLGTTGGPTEKSPTAESIFKTLEAGHIKNKTEHRVKQIHETIKQTSDKTQRNRLMRELAHLHKNAFNSMSHEERKKATSYLSNSGKDPELKTFRLHRNTKSGGVSISEPAADFDNETKDKTFGALMSGRGIHIFTQDSQGTKKSFKRLGLKSSGSIKDPLNIRGNVKRVGVGIGRIIKKEKMKAIKRVRQKNKDKKIT